MTVTSNGGDRPIPEEPLALLEELAAHNDWRFERLSTNELIINTRGHGAAYEIACLWAANHSALQVFVELPQTGVANPKRLMPLVHELNRHFLIGTLEYNEEENHLAWRYTLLMRGISMLAPESFIDLLESALLECDRATMALALLREGRVNKGELSSLTSLAVMEPAGEA